jgi:hypothetical protein
MSSKITVKQGEAKTIAFAVKDTDTNPIDLSTASVRFYVKDKRAGTYIFQKEDGDFDKTQASSGIVKVDVSAVDTNQAPKKYRGELMITFTATDIDKSQDIEFGIDEAVI